MNVLGEIRSRLYRFLTPIRPIRVDNGAKPPAKARITYYGTTERRVSQRRKRSAGERDS